MKFPGKRKSKHYFPVSERDPVVVREHLDESHVYIVGIDQLLVDIEARAEEALLTELAIPKGQSVLLDDGVVGELYARLKRDGRVLGEYAGGSVGNTLHNYSVLADDTSCLLGAITRHITVGDDAFHYVRHTSSRVSLATLQPVDGPMGRAICLITADGERSFGISRGIMNDFAADAVPEKLVAGASALVLTAYLLRNEQAPIFKATLRAVEVARRHDVPVVLSLGTVPLANERRDLISEILRGGTSVVAGNFEELCTLTRQSDPLLAGQAALELADLVLLTHDQHGLYLCAHVDRDQARETRDPIHSKSIAEYNRHEYSRAMPRAACENPLAIFSHINPYHGGPQVIRNTNGAGDAALAALLHDMAANVHHRSASPTSPKHAGQFLTYSSIHQICKYANRVSYEVLRRNAPRLMHGLPEREDSLEESYWEA